MFRSGIFLLVATSLFTIAFQQGNLSSKRIIDFKQPQSSTFMRCKNTAEAKSTHK